MLPLDDPRWKTMKGGYRVPYDASVPLRAMETTTDLDPIWNELGTELHHQGDVDEASYASVPHLVKLYKQRGIFDWNFYCIVSVIEVERHHQNNPPIPEWLLASYESAWKEIPDLAIDDLKIIKEKENIRSLLGVIAMGKGHRKLGWLLCRFDNDEFIRLYNELFGDE